MLRSSLLFIGCLLAGSAALYAADSVIPAVTKAENTALNQLLNEQPKNKEEALRLLVFAAHAGDINATERALNFGDIGINSALEHAQSLYYQINAVKIKDDMRKCKAKRCQHALYAASSN